MNASAGVWTTLLTYQPPAPRYAGRSVVAVTYLIDGTRIDRQTATSDCRRA